MNDVAVSVQTAIAGVPIRSAATWDGLGVNFAVFSAHADRIELCLFDPSGRREDARLDLPECTDEVWHGYLPNAGPDCSTAIAPTAPTSRRTATASIRNKLLLDPYAKRLAGALRWSDTLFGYRIHSPRDDLIVRPPRQRAVRVEGRGER